MNTKLKGLFAAAMVLMMVSRSLKVAGPGPGTLPPGVWAEQRVTSNK